MSNYHQVGGSLSVSNPSYVERKADKELYQALLRGEFCYVFNCRQMGKSSLRVRVKNRLQQQGYACVSLDMTNIGSKSISPLQWYKSIASEMWRGFDLMGKVKFKAWWESQTGLSPIQQLNNFISDVVLPTIEADKIFIFIDEIDSVLGLDFPTDDFFALIRYFYNQRAENLAYCRLSFALFGVATPSDLIKDRKRTPFNIGTAIELRGFTLEEAVPLIKGLEKELINPQVILKEILAWTGGQPFLTQKVCQLAVDCHKKACDCPLPGTEAAWVKDLVTTHIIRDWEAQDEPEHLRTIRDRLLSDESQASRLLGLVGKILIDGYIPLDGNRDLRYLLLSNLVIKRDDKLILRNSIYRQIFNLDWIEQQQAKLRPFSKELNFWLASNGRDKSRLLRGQALRDAQVWANSHNINQQEYQFLTASQKQQAHQAIEAARLTEIEARLTTEKRNSKQQKILIAALSFALLLATGLGVLARRQSDRAAQSERKTISTVVDSLATSSEALFASDQRLEALIQAIKARVELRKLNWAEPDLTAKVDRYLRRATYGIQKVNRLSGHSGPVWEIDFSPDRKLILSGSEDNTAKLWKLDGTLLTTYRGHTGGVWAVDFSQDQKRVITASWDRTLKLWDIDGKLLKTLTGHRDRVWEVTYAPNDEMIASASWDKTIKLWDVEQSIKLKRPVVIATLKKHRDAVNNVDFSGNGRDMVSASNDETLILWDVSNPRKPRYKKTLVGHEDRVTSVAYNKETGEIVSTSDDKTLKIWSPEGTLISTFKGHRDRVVGLGVSTDGKMLASGGYDKTIRLWQPSSNLLKTLEGHRESVWHVDFSPDGQSIVSGSRDSKIRLWTVDGGFIRTLAGHTSRVHDVVFHPSGKLLASASDDRTVKIWDLQGKVIKTLKGHQATVFTVAFSPDGNYIASAGEDQQVKIWNLQG